MKRLFIALDFPPSGPQRLAEICHGLNGANWVPEDQYHLTLRFIGEVNEMDFENIHSSLGGLQANAFFLDIKGLGHFPLRGDPQVLWIGVAKNEALQSLRNKVEKALMRCGLEPDSRKFHPHITLARLKGADHGELASYLSHHALFRLPQVPIQEFRLYSSRLSPDGAIHTVEGRYPLQGLLDEEE